MFLKFCHVYFIIPRLTIHFLDFFGSYRAAVSSIVATNYMWLFQFQLKSIKIKLKIQFFSHTAHFKCSKPHVASGYCIGQCRYRTLHLSKSSWDRYFFLSLFDASFPISLTEPKKISASYFYHL